MAKNSLAGTSTGKSKSAKYFASNPKQRAAKIKYNTEYNKTKKRTLYRVALNAANRKAGTYGKMTKLGKDRSHTKDGKLVLEKRNTNRARNGKDRKSSLK
jgi:hypothetical protein